MKITRVEVIPLNLPEKKDIADSSQDAVIVKVHTDEGIVGIGEIASHPPIVKAIVEAPMSHRDSLGVAELLIGEDPLSPDDIDGYAKLARATALRIAAGEAETTRFPFRDLMEKGNVDVIQPDVTRVGGISEAQKIAWMAYDRGVMFVPHAWSTDILVAATLHVLAAIPQESLLEFCVSDSPLKKDLLLEPFSIDEEGFVRVPEKPGLGIELNQEIIDRFSKW